MGVTKLAKEINVTRKTAGRQLELLLVLDQYFWEKNNKPVGASDVAQWAREKFFKHPEANEFLFRYRHEKAKERYLAYAAEAEARKNLRAQSRVMLSSLFLATKKSR